MESKWDCSGKAEGDWWVSTAVDSDFGGVFTSYLRAASQRHQIVDSAEREPINALFRLNLGSFRKSSVFSSEVPSVDKCFESSLYRPNV